MWFPLLSPVSPDEKKSLPHVPHTLTDKEHSGVIVEFWRSQCSTVIISHSVTSFFGGVGGGVYGSGVGIDTVSMAETCVSYVLTHLSILAHLVPLLV